MVLDLYKKKRDFNKIKQVIDKPDWVYEMKYDGYRLISRIIEGKRDNARKNPEKSLITRLR